MYARLQEGTSGAGPLLPALFTLDRDLRMPQGVGYINAGKDYYHARLDHKGRWSGLPVRLDFLAAPALLTAGLISETAYVASLKQYDHAASSGGGNAGAGDSGAGCDSGGGDAGGCAGGCGGGCGG